LLCKIPVASSSAPCAEPAVIRSRRPLSEAALPRAMEAMERLGEPRRIVSFILRSGIRSILDGTTLYLSLAASSSRRRPASR